MATWTTTARVERYLPSSHGLTLSTYITEASDYVAAQLDSQYSTFPDVSATPATPEIIQTVTALWAAYQARLALAVSNRFNVEGTTEKLREQFDLELARLRDGSVQVPPTRITGEVIAFGDGDPWGESDHNFWPSRTLPFDVVPGSVRITDQQVGLDFTVDRNAANQRWYLRAYSADIVEGVSTVSYEVSWFRRHDQDRSLSGTPARVTFCG